MNQAILQEAGLTKAEAQIYTILVKNSPSTPPQLASTANESRTNTYKLLDSLEQLGLVTRDESQPKLRYWANNPSVLLDQLKKRRSEVESAEKRFQSSLPGLVDEYFKHSEQPAIRYFHGIDGIEEVYKDQLKTKQPVTFVHSIGIRDFFGVEKMHHIRNEFPKHKIRRHAFYPDVPQAIQPGEPTLPVHESDAFMLMTRTWLDENDLHSPVEWSVYGNKLSIISLGNEVVGMIIESKQIADSFQEILTLLDTHIKKQPGYSQLPKKLIYTKKPVLYDQAQNTKYGRRQAPKQHLPPPQLAQSPKTS